jgi:hypothetical protein
MRKRELKLDTKYVVHGDRRTPHTLISLKDHENAWRVVTRVPSGHYVSMHPNQIVAAWDDPHQVAWRQRVERREADHRQALDLAERLGFRVARSDDGWVAHQDAQAHTAYDYHGGSQRDVLMIDLDAWLARAQVLVMALDVARASDRVTYFSASLDAHNEQGQHR